MTDVKYITPSQHEFVLAWKEEQERRRKEEEEAAAKKGAKKAPAKKEDAKTPDADEFQWPDEQPDEEATIQWLEVRPEPEFAEIENTSKQLPLKIFAEVDYLRYSCEVREIKFKSTLMFASRSYKFGVRNTSAISMPYRFKICHAETGKLDAGPYSVSPRDGLIAPGCDEVVTVKFSPFEIEDNCERLLVFSL
jgi:hypothetical protein